MSISLAPILNLLRGIFGGTRDRSPSATNVGSGQAAAANRDAYVAGGNIVIGTPSVAGPADWWDIPGSPRFRFEQGGQSSASAYRFDDLALMQVAGTAIGSPYATVRVGERQMLEDHALDFDRERRWRFPRAFTISAPAQTEGGEMPSVVVDIRFWWEGANRQLRYEWGTYRRGAGKNLFDIRVNSDVVEHS